MGWQFKVLAALTEDQDSVPASSRRLTTKCNPCLYQGIPLPLLASLGTMCCTDMQAKHIKWNKINLKKKRVENYSVLLDSKETQY